MAELMHYVLFKMKDGMLSEKVKEDFERTFSRLKETLGEDIIEASIKLNCIERDVNMDVMVTLRLANEKSLEKYILHPIHLSFAQRTDPILISRCSFDYKL